MQIIRPRRIPTSPAVAASFALTARNALMFHPHRVPQRLQAAATDLFVGRLDGHTKSQKTAIKAAVQWHLGVCGDCEADPLLLAYAEANGIPVPEVIGRRRPTDADVQTVRDLLVRVRSVAAPMGSAYSSHTIPVTHAHDIPEALNSAYEYLLATQQVSHAEDPVTGEMFPTLHAEDSTKTAPHIAHEPHQNYNVTACSDGPGTMGFSIFDVATRVTGSKPLAKVGGVPIALLSQEIDRAIRNHEARLSVRRPAN